MSEKVKTLQKASSAAGVKNDVADIFRQWPNLQQMTLNLVDYMGDLLPAQNGHPLLQSCLANAVEAYYLVKPEQFGKTSQMVAFMQGLFSEVHHINAHILSAKTDENEAPIVWDPFTESIHDFQSKNGNKVKIYKNASKGIATSSMKLMLLARVITVKDLALIEEHGGVYHIIEKEEVAA